MASLPHTAFTQSPLHRYGCLSDCACGKCTVVRSGFGELILRLTDPGNQWSCRPNEDDRNAQPAGQFLEGPGGLRGAAGRGSGARHADRQRRPIGLKPWCATA